MRNDGPPHPSLGLIVVPGDIHDPARVGSRRPFAGDLARVASEWRGAIPKFGGQIGSLGMIGGGIGEAGPDAELEVTFSYSAHRSSGGVSCSGGPGTIGAPVGEFRPTGETARVNCWRWHQTWMPGRFRKERDDRYGYVFEHVGANQGQTFQCEVVVWDWYPTPQVGPGTQHVLELPTLAGGRRKQE